MIDNNSIALGWSRIKVSQLVQPRGEKSSPSEHPNLKFIGMDDVESQTMRIISSKLSSTMKSAAARFYAGDVLYGRLRPYLNKVVQPNFNGLASAEFIVFPPSELIVAAYLRYRLNAADFVSFANHLNEGDRPRVSFEQIGEFELLVPPLNEQHRIVAKIEELFSEIDKGVESLKTAKAQLQVYRQALLKHAFEGKLTAQWRSNNPDKVVPAAELLRSIEQAREERYQQQLTDWQTAVEKERNGDKLSKPKLLKPNSKVDINFIIDKELPKNWCWVTFEHLLEYITSGSRGWAEYYSETGSIFVRAQNLKYDKLDLTDLAHVELPENAEGIRSKLNFGDILITITGANVTKTGVVTTDLKDAYVSQHVALCRSTNIDWFEYLYFYLLSEVGGRKQLTSAAYGAGKPGLNLANIKLVAIPFCNYAEQLIIVSEIKSHLSIIENTEADIDRDIVKAEMLRQSILKKAFSGQLVPQDPTDEPASELLKRIQAEKAERETKTKRKSTK